MDQRAIWWKEPKRAMKVSWSSLMPSPSIPAATSRLEGERKVGELYEKERWRVGRTQSQSGRLRLERGRRSRGQHFRSNSDARRDGSNSPPPMQPTRICRGKNPTRTPSLNLPRIMKTIPERVRSANGGQKSDDARREGKGRKKIELTCQDRRESERDHGSSDDDVGLEQSNEERRGRRKKGQSRRVKKKKGERGRKTRRNSPYPLPPSP